MANNTTTEKQWQIAVLTLKEIAKQKGISQGQLAELTGLKQSNISRTFSLKFPPSMRVFIGICEALKVRIIFDDLEQKTDLKTALNNAAEEANKLNQ